MKLFKFHVYVFIDQTVACDVMTLKREKQLKDNEHNATMYIRKSVKCNTQLHVPLLATCW